jgi:hypothetical protein
MRRSTKRYYVSFLFSSIQRGIEGLGFTLIHIKAKTSAVKNAFRIAGAKPNKHRPDSSLTLYARRRKTISYPIDQPVSQSMYQSSFPPLAK